MDIILKNVSYMDEIKNITYTFENNKITTLMGISGSGKTTISYLITGLVLPTKGTISIGENIIDSNTKNFTNIRKNIGYIFQNPEEQFFTNTVKEEIEFGLKNYKYNLDKIEEYVLYLLELVGLDKSYLNKNPFTLSSGEKEKLSIAIALSLDPQILILDEPTIYLDDKSINELIELLKKIKENKTIIIISNNIDFINEITDNIILLKKGKIALQISKEKLVDNIEKIKKMEIETPKIIEFINMIEKNRKIKLNYTKDINKLVSEIKKYV